jgi:hypothetical protein
LSRQEGKDWSGKYDNTRTVLRRHLRAEPEPVYDIQGVATIATMSAIRSFWVPNASQPTGQPQNAVLRPQTIAQKVAAAGAQVGNDAAVNFGSVPRTTVDPSQRIGFPVLSFWFRYGDIKNKTLAQVQLAIAAGAAASLPGGANVMRVSSVAISQFTQTLPSTGMNIVEYTTAQPIPVQQSIPVA